MKKLLSLSLLSLSLIFTGCGDSGGNDSGEQVQLAEVSPLFLPAVGLIPFPNDLYFAGTTDGTLNIPTELGLLGLDALNELDGYSTNASIKIDFDQPLAPSSIVGGSTAHLFEVTTDPATKAVSGFVTALIPGVDYSVSTSSAANGAATVLFKPLRPLNPKSSYLYALTSGITDANGATAQASATFQTIKDALVNGTTLSDPTLDQIKLFTGAHLAVLGALGVAADSVLVTGSFSTQSTTDVLQAAAAAATAQFSMINPLLRLPGIPFTSADIVPALPGYADLYGGLVETPYFLSKVDPINQPWQGVGGTALTQFNPLPVATENVFIPALITVPNATSPWYQGFVAQNGVTPEQAGWKWPLVIFQHGITGNRTNALGIVDTYAAAGYAVISIDQPLHGITDPNSFFYKPSFERTFDLDLDNDGAIDPSGSHTINLQNLLVGRDNNRQAALDLHYLAKTAPTIDINNDDIPDFDGSNMHFIGISLGGIVGTPFLGINTDVSTGTLNVPGGGIADLLLESQSFGPVIEAGLVAQGLTPNTTLYEDFFRSAQAAVDSSDPLSFAADAAANHPILLQKVLGDTVVPNSATDRLIAALGLPPVTTLGVNPGPLGAVTFIQGAHGSLLLPEPSLAATLEMQTQAVVFAGVNGLPGNGATILVQDASVVDAAP